MNDTSKKLNLLIRLLLALLFLWITYRILRTNFWFFGLMLLLAAIAAILVGPLTALITKPIGSIFSTGSKSRRINLMFSLPEARIMEGRYEDALDLLKQMIPRDPQRLEVYMRIMSLALKHLGQPEVAREIFHTGMKELKDLGKRRILATEYRRLTTLFRETKPERSDSFNE